MTKARTRRTFFGPHANCDPLSPGQLRVREILRKLPYRWRRYLRGRSKLSRLHIDRWLP